MTQKEKTEVIDILKRYRALGVAEKNLDERIAAEFVNLYPPGIPIVVPGERIDNRIIRMIKAYLDNGYTVQGVERDREDEGYYLAVVRENDQ